MDGTEIIMNTVVADVSSLRRQEVIDSRHSSKRQVAHNERLERIHWLTSIYGEGMHYEHNWMHQFNMQRDVANRCSDKIHQRLDFIHEEHNDVVIVDQSVYEYLSQFIHYDKMAIFTINDIKELAALREL